MASLGGLRKSLIHATNPFFWLCIALCACCAATSTARAEQQLDCHIGSYRLSNGNLLDIAPSEADTLRWRQFDGSTGALHKGADGKWTSTDGWTHRGDGKTAAFSPCGSGHVDFDGVSGERIAFDVRETTFKSHGTELVGRLVLPRGTGRVPIV